MIIKDATSARNLGKSAGKTVSRQTEAPRFFMAELDQKQTEISSYNQEVDELRRDIDVVAEKLQKEPHLGNFKQFRNLLSRLATKISSEAYRLEKIGGTPQNPRYYEILTVINSEADRLYSLIVNENRDIMAITAKVIGIKGLVVDLVT